MNSKTLAKLAAFASATLLLTSMASCSPKVITDISQQMPATDASEVRVYDEDAIVPNTAQVIGQVRVTDSGFCPTKRCKYPIVLDIAKQETAKAGGNALFVRLHQQPDGHSTCHRITCDMLHLTDTIVDPTQANPLMEKVAMEEKAFYDKMDKGYKLRQMPLNSIRIKGGFTFVTSRLFSDDDEMSSPWGYGFGIDYTHLWKTKTSSNERPQYIGFTLTAQYKAASQGYEIDTSFFGAGFTWASKTNKGFAWHTTVGLGYAYSTDLDLYLDNGGLGIFGTVGFDYMLTKHLGIGISLNPLVCFYSKPDFYDKTDFYGVAHYDVNLGLSWHF